MAGGNSFLNMKSSVRMVMRLRPVQTRIDAFLIAWLTGKAKFVRVAMRDLLNRKRGGRASRPGEPPTKRVGFLYRLTAYDVDRRDGVAVVGPMLHSGRSQKVAATLDRGGRASVNVPGKKQRVRAKYKARPFSQPGLMRGLREYDDKRMAGRL